MKYYDTSEHYEQLSALYNDDIMKRQAFMEAFNMVCAAHMKDDENPLDLIKGDLPDIRPCHFETFDWRNAVTDTGVYYEYWFNPWVLTGFQAGAANMNMRIMLQHDPDTPWRIVSSSRHSILWDGDETIHDLQGSAFGFSADESWHRAAEENTPVELPPHTLLSNYGAFNKLMKVWPDETVDRLVDYLAPYWETHDEYDYLSQEISANLF